MLEELIKSKTAGKALTIEDYYEAVEYLIKKGVDKNSLKFFLSLNSFGMTKLEVLYLTLAMRDSGKVFKFNDIVMEKHSTGGVGDSSSIVLIPLLASLGYKIIKTTGKSFMFTNGSADKFGAIPHFRDVLTYEEIKETLHKTNACILSHSKDIDPADKLLYEIREECGIDDNLNFLAASIASKKLTSGAKIVLVDVKYGIGSVVKTYRKAKKLSRLLRYLFKACDVKSVIVITNTAQTIGEGVGNALEVADAINVLKGKKGLLRDITVQFALEMISCFDRSIDRHDIEDMINASLDNGYAYKKFLEIVASQGGDDSVIRNGKLFKPYKHVNFISDRDGNVGVIDSYLLGELTRRLCVDSHDNNIGAVLKVKIGDHVQRGDVILSYYYKNDEELDKYKNSIAGCVRLTNQRVKPIKVIKRIIR